jgi:hypothetical protein
MPQYPPDLIGEDLSRSMPPDPPPKPRRPSSQRLDPSSASKFTSTLSSVESNSDGEESQSGHANGSTQRNDCHGETTVDRIEKPIGPDIGDIVGKVAGSTLLAMQTSSTDPVDEGISDCAEPTIKTSRMIPKVEVVDFAGRVVSTEASNTNSPSQDHGPGESKPVPSSSPTPLHGEGQSDPAPDGSRDHIQQISVLDLVFQPPPALDSVVQLPSTPGIPRPAHFSITPAQDPVIPPTEPSHLGATHPAPPSRPMTAFPGKLGVIKLSNGESDIEFIKDVKGFKVLVYDPKSAGFFLRSRSSIRSE